jgi:hypothetical protein
MLMLTNIHAESNKPFCRSLRQESIFQKGALPSRPIDALAFRQGT